MTARVHMRLQTIVLIVTSGLTSNHLVTAEDYSDVLSDPPAPVVLEQESASDVAPALTDAEVVAADEAEVAAVPMPVEMSAAPIDSAPLCSCCQSSCCTKKKKAAATDKMKGAYKGVFYGNDFSYLDDSCYDGPSFCGDSLKGLFCGKLDIGGEARVRYHSENNHRGLGLTGRDDDFWLTRLRLFADYRMNEYFRLYGEYLYADSGGENFNNRPIEENRGEIQNLFLDANLLSGSQGDLKLRAGRQELLFGAQRLISPLDWANTRRTFDGVRGMYSGSEWDVDAFFTHPVNRNAANESKIDDTNEAVDFYGVYGTRKGLDIGQWEPYYIGYNNSDVNFDYHTVGSRVVGSTDKFLYEFEGGVQFGKNSNRSSHSAGFFTAGFGKKLSICTACGEWNPIVWAWYDWASGGDSVPASRGDDSFDHLFPLAHKYNGFMDLFGRRNLNDVNAQFITPILGSRVKMLIWYHYFFLDQKTTPYGVTMQPFNPNNRAGDRELGHEIDVLFQIALNPRHSMLVGYSFFDSGKYYKTTPGVVDVDAQFFYTQYQVRF